MQSRKSNRLRRFKRILAGLICLVAAVILIWTEENWRSHRDWNNFKRSAEARGEKLDFKDFVPPPVSEKENFALTPLIASNRLFDVTVDDENYWNSGYQGADLGDWPAAKITDLATWQRYYRWLPTKAEAKEFPIPSHSQIPAQDVLFALNQYDKTIEALRDIMKLPASRFPLNYDAENPEKILLPHLSGLKYCAQVLELRAAAELQNDESNQALNDVVLAMQLTGKIHNEPFIDSQLTRATIVQDAIQSIYEGLAARKWSDAQLVELDAELAKFDFLADYQFSMRAEEAVEISETEYLRRTRNLRPLDNSDFINEYGTFDKIIFRWAPSAIFFRNELNIVKLHQQWIFPAVDVEKRIVFPKMIENSAVELKSGSCCDLLARMFFQEPIRSAAKFPAAQSSVDLARTAIALERYRLANGNYPDSLAALMPRFMDKVPHDIIGGQPLHYRRTEDGQFILYSIGWNGTDDGGISGMTSFHHSDFRKGDWVWRYPKKEV